jgi:hypothetical protein
MEANASRTGRAIPIGMALAATVGIGYAGCALAFGLWPEAAVTFMNALFHGLDFGKLQAGPAPFDFGGFFFALAGIVIWAFLMGALFGAIVDRLRGPQA